MPVRFAKLIPVLMLTACVLSSCYADTSVWDSFEPGLVTLASPDPQASRPARGVHWEACDDPREFTRHLGDALLMGVGGVMAAGCTIGQGISAFSLLALSAPVALLGIVLGAKPGLTFLFEGLPGVFQR